jgi:hypothetical protein
MAYRVPGKYLPSLWQRGLAGLLAVVTTALGLAAWLLLRSFAIRPLLDAYARPTVWRSLDQWIFIMLGFIWLALVYLSAHLYQKAVERRQLWRLFARVTLIELLAPALIVGIVFLLVR